MSAYGGLGWSDQRESSPGCSRLVTSPGLPPSCPGVPMISTPLGGTCSRRFCLVAWIDLDRAFFHRMFPPTLQIVFGQPFAARDDAHFFQ